MKKIIIFLLPLMLAGCSLVEKITDKSNKNADNKEVVIEQNKVDTTIISNYDALSDPIVIDTVDHSIPDSVRLRIQELFDENSGEDIVLESEEMLEMIDTLAVIPYFEKSNANSCNYPAGYVPTFPDSIYAQRIEELSRQTTIELVYNQHVKSLIDVYAIKKRDKTARMLGLAEVYFPMFEQCLDKYSIPLELKYLAVVESALNPTAGSHAGAKGLWQFMYGTGKSYKLNSTTLVEDRFDPLKSTEAACQHLRDLYNQFGDWFLALAAYNSGGGNVRKAIARAGGIKNYWAIWPFLPRETRGYVPAFIAVNYVMSYYAEHNICPLDPGIIKDGIDTVTVHQPLHFEQLNEMLGIPLADLKFFNPQYKQQIIPASDKTPYLLSIPEEYVEAYIKNEKALYEFKTKRGIDKEKLKEEMKKISESSVHIVKSGENLSVIAKRYHVSVSQLQKWNNLKGTTIRVGQKLVVYASGAPASQSSSTKPSGQSTKSSSSTSSTTTYTVKSGDSLWSISQKFNTTVDKLKKLNNLKSNNLKVGQKLKVK